jgi:hypothetical protein
MPEQLLAVDTAERRRRFSRRSFLRIGLGFGAAVPLAGGLLAACSSPAPSAAPVATQVAAAAPTVASVATQVSAVSPTAAAAVSTVSAAAPTAVSAASTVVAQVAPTLTAGTTFKVSILNQQMSKDEVAAGLKKEGEVNVANWTYTANDAIVGRFQDVIKAEVQLPAVAIAQRLSHEPVHRQQSR